jgi:hypothetical protein
LGYSVSVSAPGVIIAKLYWLFRVSAKSDEQLFDGDSCCSCLEVWESITLLAPKAIKKFLGGGFGVVGAHDEI